MHMAIYACSNQIPIFFPNYYVVTVTACISIDSIGVLDAEKTKIAGCRNIGITMLCVKCGLTQSMDCPVQSSDRYFVQQNIDFVRISWIVHLVFCAKYG